MSKQSNKRLIKKNLLFALGIVSLVLGAIGALLPLLPTTPFMILAAYCFSRSSERFDRWIHQHPRFGPPIRAWNEKGAIHPRAKFLAIFFIAISIAVIVLSSLGLWIRAAFVLLLFGISMFIFTRPGP